MLQIKVAYIVTHFTKIYIYIYNMIFFLIVFLRWDVNLHYLKYIELLKLTLFYGIFFSLSKNVPRNYDKYHNQKRYAKNYIFIKC